MFNFYFRYAVFLIIISLLFACENSNPKTLDLLVKDKSLLKRIEIKKEQLYIDAKAYPPQKVQKEKTEKLKIAIDPGHIGGSLQMARMEEKYIRFLGANQDTLTLIEGDLTMTTALLIKKLLEKHPEVEVFLTRQNYGESALGKDYRTWLKNDLNTCLDSLVQTQQITKTKYRQLKKQSTNEKYLFQRFFKNFDLKHRAALINKFQPDMTLLLHYNVHRTDWKQVKDNFIKPKLGENYTLFFVPGAFLNNELRTPSDKMAFSRLYYQEDLEASINFAKILTEECSNILKVKPVPPKYEAYYPLNQCVKTDTEGVYARNLALTRLVASPLCYGETLCMDHKEEIGRLYKKDRNFEGIQCSQRVYEVAFSYYQALVKYYKLNEIK